ncbi:DUF3239 domain-containing protein [Corynebacterium sp. 13CS0277]|uniref:DUF3239 domain-containing protein n=1 Tax=Corynebacterium sp. 13CS0277 TaxID=2071994 RepID=UPI000D038946|nr:DUF3239 domain-containing protein [Corynebacterium sp. 13CS0277]PRQ10985.1 DUF3239 domain-containing protein [Corynebacterium sp. 13CS0277]
MHIPVDAGYNAAHNELYRDAKRLVVSAIVMAILLSLGAAGAAYTTSGTPGTMLAVLCGLGAVFCLAVIPMIRRSVGDAEHNYNSNPLVPAIVAKVTPRDGVLLALVNTTMDPDAEPQWALACRTVTRINGATPKLGTRVPSVAMRGRTRSHDTHYTQISPMPVDWATPDKAIVTQATKAIPHSEWTRLEGMRDRIDEVMATPNNLLPL